MQSTWKKRTWLKISPHLITEMLRSTDAQIAAPADAIQNARDQMVPVDQDEIVQSVVIDRTTAHHEDQNLWRNHKAPLKN